MRTEFMLAPSGWIHLKPHPLAKAASFIEKGTVEALAAFIKENGYDENEYVVVVRNGREVADPRWNPSPRCRNGGWGDAEFPNVHRAQPCSVRGEEGLPPALEHIATCNRCRRIRHGESWQSTRIDRYNYPGSSLE